MYAGGKALRVVLAALLMIVGAVQARAQGGNDAALDAWERTLLEVERQAATLQADDREAIAESAGRLRELDAQVTQWLRERGRPVEAAPQGEDLVSVVAGVSRARALVAQARAVERDSVEGSGVFYLGRVDVAVAARAERESPAVTSLDAAALRALDARTVTQALSAAPGVTLQRMGARNEGMVYVRGFDLRQVPLFVDGVPVYVPYDGYVDLDRFVTDDLSEVRVTKGMTSVLIGPNALGGAINLVSKRPSRPLAALFNAGLGSGGLRTIDGSIGLMRPGWYLQGTGSWIEADNFPLSGDFPEGIGEDGGARDNSSRGDGKGSVKFGWTPSGRGEYVVSYVGQRGRKDVPSYAGTNTAVARRFWRWPDWDKDAVYLVTNTPLGGSQYVRGRAYYDRFYNLLQSFDDAGFTAQTRPSSFNSIYDDYSAGGSVEYGASLALRHTLRAAGHFKEDIHREHNVGSPVQHFDNRTVSFGVEDVVAVSSRVTVIAGIGVNRQMTRRAENNVNGEISSFPLGDTGGVNPQAGIYLATPGQGRLRASASRKTRLPAIKDRYSYRMGRAIPNPDLDAEQATTVEGGYDGPIGRYGSAAVTVFYAAVNDIVQPFFLQPNLFQLQNVGDVRSSGLEAEWRVPPTGAFEGSIGYSYLHRKTVSETAVPLLNTPAHKVFGFAAYTGIPRVRLLASVNAESAREVQDDAGVLLSLDGYSTVAAKAVIAIHRTLDLEVSATNVFDRYYELASGFPESGRVSLVQLRYRY